MPGAIRLDAEWALLPLLVIVPAIVWHGARTHAGRWTLLLRLAAACYVAAMIGLAFFPLPLPPYELPAEGITDYRGLPYPWVSPVPFETIRSSLGLGFEWPAARYLLGNVTAFAPLGALLPTLRPGWDSWRRVALGGLIASLAIELTQLGMSLVMGFPYRVADVDDVILNCTGTLLGYAALQLGRVLVHAPWAPERPT